MEDTKAFELSRFLPFRVTSLAEGMSRSLAQRYRRPFDVTVPEWRILATLNQKTKLTAGELKSETSMEKPRVSRALTKMEKRGVIKRVPDLEDQRITHIQLTPRGRGLYKKIEPVAIAWEQALLTDLSSKEIECVGVVLDKLAARLAKVD